MAPSSQLLEPPGKPGRFKVEVEVRPGWNEPVNLYWAVAMESGSCKSSVFRHALAPVVEYERKLQASYSPTAEQSQRDVLKKAHDKAVADAAKEDGLDPLLNKKVEDLAHKLDALPRVAAPRLKADDVTAEKLGVLLEEQGGRIGVFSAETSIFEIMGGRYSDGQGKFEIFLSGHAGDDVAVDRVGRPPLMLHSPAVTMGVCVQPSVIRQLGRADFKEKGLLARFFYCLPVSRVGERTVDPLPVPEHVSEAYRRLLLDLLGFPARKEDGRFIPRFISPDAHALRALLDFKQMLEPKLGQDGELEQIRSWCSKLPGAIARLAGVLQAVEDQRANEITLPVMERAIRIGSYLLEQAKLAFGMMGTDPAVAGARRILRWFSTTGRTSASKREIYEGNRAFGEVEAMNKPLSILVELGYLREKRADRQGSGRKPSPVFELNPLLKHAPQNPQNPQN
jgi:hypothetical protein